MEDVSNTRPLAIFSSYMATAAILTVTSIAVIRNAPPKPAKRPLAIAVFSVLAAISLGTTWYHMFCFFRWSYSEWAAVRTLEDPDALYLGAWLRDTTLFRQAWGSTLETAPRAWWCLQIFGFCANWSVMLAAQEKKRKIPHMWAFMLLGQIVAISFASNLFFLAVLMYPRAQRPKAADATAPEVFTAPFWYDTIVTASVALAVAVPATFGKPRFMYFLLAPHIMAFLPLLLNRLMPRDPPESMMNKPSHATGVGGMLALVAFSTLAVVDGGGDWTVILKTLHEHPAVSSVGWDVICCWVSYGAWFLLGEA